MKTISTIIVISLSTLLLSCSSSITTTPNSIPKKMAELDNEISTIIGSASCTSTNQCHSIGFGHKACGGFMSYRLYSDQNTNVAQLKNRVDKHYKLSKEWNRINNTVSNCMMLAPPTVSCRGAICQKN